MAGLYIHIPYCKQACHYCDFHFSTNLSQKSLLVSAICHEIELQKNYLEGEPLDTIYFGGGTPSLLEVQEFERIFGAIHENFSSNPEMEITIEGNPDDLDTEKIYSLKALGANRLSIGVQSFDDGTLRFLNRAHNSRQAKECVRVAQKAGFDNISLDLIYAIPGRDSKLLNEDLGHFLSLNPQHISAYSLTVEEKTAFGKWQATKKLIPTSDEENASQFEMVMDVLQSGGLTQYEISNYAKPGFVSRHNSNYWKQKKYLGIGPSAHSFSGSTRHANVSNNHTYVKAIANKTLMYLEEVLSREDHINEYLMTSLRTSWGCDLNFLLTKYQYDLAIHQQDYILKSVEVGLMQIVEGKILLSRRGKMLADKISSDLFLIP
jgi:oxygen-independent coproporphyrinogen III oxidase